MSSSCMSMPILLAKLKNCCKSSSGKSGATQSGFQTHIWKKISSNSDVKTAADNWLNGQGRDFYKAGLNKLVLLSDKCLNTLCDYVEM
ncbi:hypothetical protein AVEN_107222-1 [Araneus ventricosus]|uniref:Uncharacterized protein n=1 Tax=Araneus ventricosus TaxID=182803 RepID=A0A4Y2B160_ARAVE|nr:hypothetical protein AVEN_107222-1 [Araneus ventricosus]